MRSRSPAGLQGSVPHNMFNARGALLEELWSSQKIRDGVRAIAKERLDASDSGFSIHNRTLPW